MSWWGFVLGSCGSIFVEYLFLLELEDEEPCCVVVGLRPRIVWVHFFWMLMFDVLVKDEELHAVLQKYGHFGRSWERGAWPAQEVSVVLSLMDRSLEIPFCF